MNYDQRLKNHLAEYKLKRLEVQENGLWKGHQKEYPHILPEHLQQLNILETNRSKFWSYYDSQPGLKLHKDFHHLNSSQAMCFNLFYPCLDDPAMQRILLTEILNCGGDTVREAAFEKVLDKAEGTNFDFFIQLSSGRKVFFELKLSESKFGTARNDQAHREKLEAIYRPRLEGKVSPDVLETSVFFQYYQILRNISYIDPAKPDVLFFIFPRMNEKLSGLEDFLAANLSEELKVSRVVVLHLEDVISRILNSPTHVSAVSLAHYQLFGEKYILEE
jgi:hypothetical protein